MSNTVKVIYDICVLFGGTTRLYYRCLVGYVMLIIVCILYCGFWLNCLYFVSWHLVFLNAISSWNYSAGVIFFIFFIFHYHSKCNIVIILSQNQKIILRYWIISLLKCLCNSLHKITWFSECEKSNMSGFQYTVYMMGRLIYVLCKLCSNCSILLLERICIGIACYPILLIYQ